MPYDYDNAEGWDCDPFAQVLYDEPDRNEDDDWQEIALDRFGDRLVNGDY